MVRNLKDNPVFKNGQKVHNRTTHKRAIKEKPNKTKIWKTIMRNNTSFPRLLKVWDGFSLRRRWSMRTEQQRPDRLTGLTELLKPLWTDQMHLLNLYSFCSEICWCNMWINGCDSDLKVAFAQKFWHVSIKFPRGHRVGLSACYIVRFVSTESALCVPLEHFWQASTVEETMHLQRLQG